MAFTISPNMGLAIPGIGTEYSPNWAVDLNASLSAIDSHNHSTGQGVQITPNGLNINSSLPFNGQQATGMGAVIFNNLLSLATTNALYVVGGDLWYNDVTGAVQITSGGAVNATSSGISSGTATAAFSAGVLVVKSTATSGANVLMQSAVLTNSGNLTNQLTLQAPTLSGSITETLPSIPASTSIMTIDTSGNMSGSIPIATSGLNPAGAIIAFGGSSAPSGYLLCDGSAVSRSTYSALFSAIASNYGNGDGSTTFNVPDLRGQFLRGVSGASGHDPDASSRTANNAGGNTGNNVGSQQSYQLQSHAHTINTDSGVGGAIPSLAYFGASTATTELRVPSVFSVINNTGGNETRPSNVYANFIIKT